jgi:sulfur carrier protein
VELSINGKISEVNFTNLGEWASAEFDCPAANINGIALAVNDKIIPKSKWEEFCLQNGDHILAIGAVQGG